jgi:hypothetical protein
LLEVGALLGVRQALKRGGLRRKVADTPTSLIRSAAMGPVELKGQARLGDPAAAAPFSGRPCCWWRVTVEEERVTRTRNGESHEWVQIHAEACQAPFALDDGTGRVDVDPQGAEVRAPRALEFVSAGVGLANLFGGGAPAALAPQAMGWIQSGLFASRRRLREWRVDEGRPLYALGVLRPRHGADGQPLGPALEQGRQGEPFLLSTDSEEDLLKSLGWAEAFWLGLALAAAGLGAWLLQMAWV